MSSDEPGAVYRKPLKAKCLFTTGFWLARIVENVYHNGKIGLLMAQFLYRVSRQSQPTNHLKILP